MFWLAGVGFSLDNQLVILTIAVVLLMLWQRRSVVRALASGSLASCFKFDNDRLRQAAVFLLAAFLIFQLVFIVLMVTGRPLTIWDSWVNWGSKGRTIFLENGITPALYADPSREVMLLGYPLAVPLLEAWLYGWLGAADDRLVGVLFVLTFLALAGFVYGLCRRRGLTGGRALLVMGAAVSLGHIVGLTATAFTDLWLAVLLVVSAVYLLEWLENRQPGYLLISAAAAGLLPWFKQEGMILVLVLLVSFSLTYILCRAGRGWKVRPLFVACGLIGLAASIFGGPWRLFAAREAALVYVFLPLTVDNLLAQLDRIPTILWLVAKELVNPRTGFVWLLVPAVFFVRWSQFGRIIRRPATLLLLVPILYVGIMGIPYLFSDFVPYDQHILSSFFRINAHVVLLLLLWLGIGNKIND
jgi:hypothetical protein